jgi:hypothetical protein
MHCDECNPLPTLALEQCLCPCHAAGPDIAKLGRFMLTAIIGRLELIEQQAALTRQIAERALAQLDQEQRS